MIPKRFPNDFCGFVGTYSSIWLHESLNFLAFYQWFCLKSGSGSNSERRTKLICLVTRDADRIFYQDFFKVVVLCLIRTLVKVLRKFTRGDFRYIFGKKTSFFSRYDPAGHSYFKKGCEGKGSARREKKSEKSVFQNRKRF